MRSYISGQTSTCTVQSLALEPIIMIFLALQVYTYICKLAGPSSSLQRTHSSYSPVVAVHANSGASPRTHQILCVTFCVSLFQLAGVGSSLIPTFVQR